MLDSPIDSSMASSMESLVLESDENSTPCKIKPSPSSQPSSRRKSTLNAITGLPPLRPLQPVLEDNNRKHEVKVEEQKSAKKEVKPDTPEKPAWDASFVKPVLTPSRIPWSSDIRMRKTAAVEATAATASPRTPHVSQINVKRQKQQSQLSRPALIKPQEKTVEENNGPTFAVPQLPSKSSSALSTNVKELQEQIKVLRQELEEERKAKSVLELKYQKENKVRVKIEMEYNLLLQKLESAQQDVE